MASATVVYQRIARLVRGAPADEDYDADDQYHSRKHHGRDPPDDLLLSRAEKNRIRAALLRPHRDLILLLGEPADGVEEEVAVALEVEELVRGKVRGAVDDEARLVLRHYGSD